jgi:hypothetical protein
MLHQTKKSSLGYLKDIVFDTLSAVKRGNTASEVGKVAFAVKRIRINRNIKRKPTLAQNRPGKHIERDGCVHSNLRAKFIELPFHIRIHPNTERCLRQR